ncbi:TonB-dependent receptor [Shewanella intestini]|uniref:TonB-dependent receptor n=1 Tax=Shewanella intestini TaxID=2017544 RepID=A0ABS5I158_9GAMM|nr:MULTISPECIES: TonB-dependent receptor [Shewanella]MBR9727135.1 TonB-dependent receptor [Shewanella intestini]MRG35937.1 TonB-dependent receptor [Shewanella sp. XMDDZSB0408]
MSLFKPSLLTLALAAAGASMGAYAVEDDVNNTTADESIEVIKVSGIRRSLQKSQSLKMSNSSVVEAISSEDIGKLPDVSIAESLARLPGIAAQRLDGRANVVSIRGLGPDFTMATLNGREQASINDNRGVEFDQYPSELLDTVVVYKTPDASLMTQAIGGTVDMQTISPLRYGERTIAVNLRGESNDLGALNSGSDDKGYRGSISYIDQFADDTIGIALGYSRMQSPNQEERWQAWGYPEDANGDKILGGAKPYVRSSELERDGVMAVFEYVPNEHYRSVVDVFYTKFYDEQILRGAEIPGAWGGGWANSGTDSISSENGLVTQGIIRDAGILIRNDANTRDANSLSIGWNNEYHINTNWTVEADIAMSKVDRTDIGIETYAGTGRGNGNGVTEDLGFSYNGEGGYNFNPALDYSDPNLIRLGGAFSWGPSIDSNMQDGFINKPEIEDELKSLRLGTTYTFDDGFIHNIEFGVNMTQREKTKDDNGYYLTLKGYDINTAPDYMMTVPEKYLLSPTSLAFFGMGNMLSYDALAFYNDGNYDELDASTVQLDRSVNSWQVEEKVNTFYVKADFETDVGHMPLTGNFGVQAVHTDQSSKGTAATVLADGSIGLTPSYGEDSYLEWLPSFNVALEVAEGQRVVFAAARTLSRARMDKMNANVSYSYDKDGIGGVYYSGSAGNPSLRPWMARQYDISYENYFSDQGYFSIAAYYKDLENYVYDQTAFVDFSEILPGVTPGEEAGEFSSPQNGQGGYVQGIEASISLDFGYFANALEGFGTILNGSYNDSEVKETSQSDPTTLPGLSEKTFNATVYYENSGFEARVSSRYRSEFLGEVTAISLSRVNVNVDAETVVDAQIGYDFGEAGFNSLAGLSVQLQVNNLTNEPFTTYFGEDDREVRDYQNYGRNYMLGANYKF